jgi:hypothetical protein
MRKPLIIGDKIYKFKKDALLHYREILNSYNFGQSLNEDDFNDLIDLLSLANDNNENSKTELDNSNAKEIFAFNKSHFSDSQINTLENENKRYIKCQTSKTKFINYENVEKLSRDIQIFKNERYFCITDGNFIFGDFIEAFIVCRNMKVKELTISTLSLSENNVDSLYNLLKGGYVENINIVTRSAFRKSVKSCSF